MDSILSVGIDIGTSTTSMVVSRLEVQNTASCFTVPRVAITGAELVYRGTIYPTPQAEANRIDIEAVSALLQKEYQKAGITPDQVQTGAVIITGESSRKENAAMVTEHMSNLAGEFVVASAGPDLESIIAAKGAGAQQFSQENGCTVANLDVGGGTTNIAVFNCGDLVAKGCWDIGGRLLKVQDGKVSYLSPRMKAVADSIGVDIRLGETADAAKIRRVTDRMAALMAESLGLVPATPLCELIRTPEASEMELDRKVDRISFSGGVADYIYHPSEDWFQHGDIGPLLAASIHDGVICQASKVIPAKETIRATVVGAGSYTTTVSGSTIAYSGEELFPMKNLPAFFPARAAEEAAVRGDGSKLRTEAEWFLQESGSDDLIFCFNRIRQPGYKEVCALADAMVQASESLPAGQPLLVLTEQDFAKALGQALRRRLKDRAVICIDGIQAVQGDYLDLGRPLMAGLAIPVVVKTLIFG